MVLVVIVAGVLLPALGFLLAAYLQGRKSAALAVQLEQARQALDDASRRAQHAQEEIKALGARLHEKDVAESRLQAALGNAQDTEQRLKAELAERKDELNTVRSSAEQIQQQLHATEKQLESAQADRRAQGAQIQELRERLGQSEQNLQQEREAVHRLKDQLAEAGKKAEALESRLAELDKHFEELRATLEAEKQRSEALLRDNQELLRINTQLKTEQEERDASHARELANFEQQKQSLTEQFKVLSNEILEAKTRALQESSKLTLSAVMNPFQQSIESFKREVQEIHHRETTQQGELRKELESLKELNRQITQEAHELSTALRGQKKLQGNWGELVLENVLDRSGLQLGKDYAREVSITTEEGRQRPDVVVYLPQNRHLIIDAKVSLNAYTRYVNAEDELERAQALKEHVSAVASRIRELADRNYYKLPGLNSPEMVFMFIPIESAFVEALKADETLFQQAIENNVLVATPTTLLTSLNIVRQLWRYEDQNKHTAALASKAESVFKKLNSFLVSFEKVKKGLDTATEAYLKAEGQLISGKGNLVKQVSEFKNLAPAIRAELPEYFTEKAALEIDFAAVHEAAANALEGESDVIADGDLAN